MQIDLSRAIALPFIGIIRLYQRFISPSLPDSCIYHPTCSTYAIDSLKIHGLWKGIFLSTFRVLRCNPFAEGGFDPVHSKGTSLLSSIKKNTANIKGENG